MSNTIRADKLLSSLGVTSRRNIGSFLKENTVMIGKIRLEKSGARIGIGEKIYVNGKLLQKPTLVYYKLNKPKGYISTVKDEYGRKNVMELIKTKTRIFPIGRLDKDTHGLLLFSNDGELTNNLIHPKKHVSKVYELTISGRVEQKTLNILKTGVELDDGITLPAQVKIVMKDLQRTVLELKIFEGRKRQIRRMCEATNLKLIDLKRIAFGPIHLGNLGLGEFKPLTQKELKLLKECY